MPFQEKARDFGYPPLVRKRTGAQSAVDWVEYVNNARPGEGEIAYWRRKQRESIPAMPETEPIPAALKGLVAGIVIFLILWSLSVRDAEFFAFWSFVLISLAIWPYHAVTSRRARQRRWEWSWQHWPYLTREEQQLCNYRRWAEENWEHLSDLEREEVKHRLFPQQAVYEPNMTTTLIIADSIASHRHGR